MNRCDEYTIKTLRHLDEDLEGQELEDFLFHLDSCAGCREQVESEKELSATLHRCRPLYSAPAALRDRLAAVALDNVLSNRTRGSIDQPAFRILRGRLSTVLRLMLNWRVLAPASVAIALCLAVVPNVERRVQAASYIETAVAEHRSYIKGNLPPGLESSSPEQVTAWFRGKVPFDFRLPAAEPAPEKKLVYWLTGARLVNFKGSPAALITYERRNDKISLLAESSELAVVAGGDQIRFGNLIFHYKDDSGFRVITWSNHGLSYALVSSVSGPASTSCLVCHQNMADSSEFKIHK